MMCLSCCWFLCFISKCILFFILRDIVINIYRNPRGFSFQPSAFVLWVYSICLQIWSLICEGKCIQMCVRVL